MAQAPPVVAPPPGHPRFPLLDSLRAIAAIAVLANHAAFFTAATQTHWWGAITSNANLGVAVFFVLSGFLLYRPFVNAQLNGAPEARLRDFMRRRLLRIVPAYWLALTVLQIYPGLPGDFSQDWWRYYFFLQAYDSLTVLGGIGQAWTLSVEVSFYLALPFYAALLGWVTHNWDARRRVRVELVFLAELAVASLAMRYFWLGRNSTMSNTLPAMFDWFALGMGMALVSAAFATPEIRRPAVSRLVAHRPAVCWGLALIVFALICVLFPNRSGFGYTAAGETLRHHALGGLAAALLVLPAVFGWTAGGWPRRALAWPVLAWLGLISYGIYLWQEVNVPLRNDLGIGTTSSLGSFAALFAAALVVSAACAAASYYTVERPLLRLKDWRRRPLAQRTQY